MNRVLPSSLPAVSWNGKQYAVPMDYAGIGIIYNKDIFEKYNLTPPATYRELEKVCRELKNNNIVPFAGLLKENWSMGHFITMIHTSLLKEKNIDPEIKKKKAILVSQIMKNIGKSDILQNKKEDLIEEKNINNEKKEKEDENNINNEIIEKKEKIPRNINNKNKIPSSRNNLQLNQNGLNLITRNVDNENKGSGILSKTEEEKIMITLKYNDSELNVLDFKEALKYDNRNYFQYYLSLLKTKHLIVKVINKTDYNSRMIKIFLIFFNFALCFTVNALFFSDDTMHKILEDGGDFNFIYQLPQIIYSAIISFIFENILGFLAMSEENILSIKHEKVIRNIKRKAEDVMRNLQMKFLCFFILSFFFLIGFWYYATCFCAVYTNTQLILIYSKNQNGSTIIINI